MYWSASFCARGMSWVPSTITPLSSSSASTTADAATLRGRNGFPLGRLSVVMVSGMGGLQTEHSRDVRRLVPWALHQLRLVWRVDLGHVGPVDLPEHGVERD